MLARHGAQRRAAVSSAARSLAEAAALNRRVATWAREQGHALAAVRLHEEAVALDLNAAHLVHLADSVLHAPSEA